MPSLQGNLLPAIGRPFIGDANCIETLKDTKKWKINAALPHLYRIIVNLHKGLDEQIRDIIAHRKPAGR
jgi:hypothetical protein